ncbi:LADA_0G12706g1_1 [Lachancea dasiensis]|uniref:LADA_0G12706g1_1 n=1 Tax=Lachancea dasiensis TaxID=1072105 RepID=A0A1G4JVK7_9SACH|nr:LADA_0G12706g1_1 [Lachancea dasiensis]
MQTSNRLRVRKACITCKKRKVKCDGQNPCQNCVKHAINCIYKSDHSKPLLKPATETPELNIPFHHSILSPWQCYSPHKYRFHRRHQNLLPYYLGRTLMNSLTQSIIDEHALRPPRLQFYGWNMSGGHYLKQRQTLPSNDSSHWQWDFSDPIQQGIVEKLAHFYFANVNRFSSIIHEQAFWQQFRAGFVKRDPHGSSDLFEAILNLIVAIALRFSHTRDTNFAAQASKQSINECLTIAEVAWIDTHQNLEESLFDYAYTVTTQLSFEWESFELIQSWLLMAFYLRTCHRQVSCWQALSRAVQMCNGMSLFLNRYPEYHNAYDECRARNCYWACFTLERVIGFQIGRLPELSLPGPLMDHPSSASDSWLSTETIALYQLALIITDCQKRYGEELSVQDYQSVKSRLLEWQADVGPQLVGADLCTKQVFLTYWDVRVALEIKGLFPFLDVDENYGHVDDGVLTTHPTHTPTLLSLVGQILNAYDAIVESGLYFRPWWLNLSLLFISSIICLILIQSGLKQLQARSLLQQSFKIWRYIERAKPPNPPGMATECVWCLKMLNHMFCQRLKLSANVLESIIGLDHANDAVNNIKFHQFGKVDKEVSSQEPVNIEMALPILPTVEDATENVLAHLQWFDQWLDVHNLDTML